MVRGLLLVSAISIAGLTYSGGSALSAPAASMASALPQMTLVEQAQYRNYCRRWYRECRYRWGAGWKFRRCLRIRGC